MIELLAHGRSRCVSQPQSLPCHRLQVAPARRDDTAPGVFAPNYARMHGSLSGSHIDVADLYRFTIAHRSSLKVKLSTRGNFVMSLYSLSGRRLTSATGELDWSIKPGRYFVQVRAQGGSSGRYTLQRISRAVTRTRVSIKGRHRTTSLPGVTIPIGATMTPSIAGPVTIDVQRFDPVHGWQFFHRYSVTAHAGTATVSFRPPSVGRWRAKATFEGTRSASPSVSGFAEVLVARPIPK